MQENALCFYETINQQYFFRNKQNPVAQKQSYYLLFNRS